MALAEQRKGVMKIVDALASQMEFKLPVVVGGYAVKMEKAAPIPGTRSVSNVSDLVELLQRLSPPKQATSDTSD